MRNKKVSFVKKLLKKRDLSKGFTLVELLVVIAIIGVLSTMLLLQLGTARAKARDAKRVTDVNQIRTAVEMFFDDNGGRYPSTIDSGTDKDILVKYMTSNTLPTDPISGGPYGYSSYGRVATPIKAYKFHLYAELERKNTAAFAADADINSSDTAADKWPTAGVQGFVLDAGTPAVSELCAAAYAPPDLTTGALDATARDCVYDVGTTN
ncbi:MAG: hypothetical protein A2568_01155 [Candidatus Yanofskybacteria bacterium RIFOXYD1_FULL_44_17]|nr:MAG: hypothetical protein A2241_03770 [Candidatus Yanofskybacteria bacterium RIFOXYA2_FULL_45_28]OGN36600.1 MAG: hypothetical protein A2207_00485 [Candidatus Yanofskybacteria bacterium RIFOXYA1_FULL_44_17]OGN37272.1 MAG: hypothetical protein A2302_02995 [Candidatus Yanofskybacteria bacterium RIFOXYB2_FULL_44_18]OGN37708.1 MAG: hypothetical protein A2405_02945 [Candidatus Yanofskybacteria bacterium RIFOXYC1_FULL_44_16]OGN39343.1 MAG: hypothetical protein A2457_02225 [Candidatus Yanofskybacter